MRRPTLKMQRFAKAYVENGGNATQATLKSYGTGLYASARPIGSENLTKPIIRQEINRVLGESGVTLKRAAVISVQNQR